MANVGPGSILANILGGLLAPALAQAGPNEEDGTRTPARQNARNPRVDGGMGAETAFIRNSGDGKSANVIFRVQTPGMVGAIARQQLQARGMDNGDVGYRGISQVAERNGNDYTFNINGNKRTVTGDALMNARGNELANLLGLKSFMEMAKTRPQNSEPTPIAPQNQQPGAAVADQRGTGTTVAASPVGPGTQAPTASATPQTESPQLGAASPLEQVPSMSGAPPSAMAPSMTMMPIIGYQQNENGQLIPIMPFNKMPGSEDKPKKAGSRAGMQPMALPGLGVSDMYSGSASSAGFGGSGMQE